MELTTYRIDKLEGVKNWPKFEYEMPAIFEMDDVWELVSGEELPPIKPNPPLQHAAYTDEDGIQHPAVDATAEEAAEHQKQMAQ